MLICDIMIYYYIIMVVYVCLRFWYSCGLVATLYSRIIPILHNAIFGDLRHFYIFMCIFLCVCCKIVYIRQIRKAGTLKNATGRSTPKTEHARTNYEIVPKSKTNFEKILFRFFVWEIHTPAGIKIFNSNFYIGAFQIFSYSHRYIGVYRKN